MMRRATLTTLCRRRVRGEVARRAQARAQWEERWTTALSDAEGDQLESAVADRVADAVAARQRDADRLVDALRRELLAHRSGYRTSVERLFRDAADRMAVTPYLGADPERTRAARDVALEHLTHQWSQRIERSVTQARDQLARLADRHPWSDSDRWSRLLAERGVEEDVRRPVAPEWSVPEVSPHRVLVEEGEVLGGGGPEEIDADGRARVAVWAEHAAARAPDVAPGGWDIIADTWARL